MKNGSLYERSATKQNYDNRTNYINSEVAKDMKVAIHHREGSFSDRWIAYCEKKAIPYVLVNSFESDFIQQIKDCDVFLWHHHHANFKDVITAKRILFALEHAGIKVFPDFNSSWHFDDKVAQKYLLEAVDAPLVPSYVFYNKREALDWATSTNYPKVFKLKGGAGSANVKLVRTKNDAFKLIIKAFDRGFPQFDRLETLKERFRKFRAGQESIVGVIRGLGRLFIATDFSKQQPPEKGYVYFQDFVANNDSDIRVVVIGNKAFAIKRLVRKNDFRASGSGNLIYDDAAIDTRCVEVAFETNRKLDAECLAYDFVFNIDNEPMIVEISYGFAVESYDPCPGYWDNELNWNQGQFNPQEWMIDDLFRAGSNG